MVDYNVRTWRSSAPHELCYLFGIVRVSLLSHLSCALCTHSAISTETYCHKYCESQYCCCISSFWRVYMYCISHCYSSNMLFMDVHVCAFEKRFSSASDYFVVLHMCQLFSLVPRPPCSILWSLYLRTASSSPPSLPLPRYNDPPYVKMKKLEVLAELCTTDIAPNIVEELG